MLTSLPFHQPLYSSTVPVFEVTSCIISYSHYQASPLSFRVHQPRESFVPTNCSYHCAPFILLFVKTVQDWNVLPPDVVQHCVCFKRDTMFVFFLALHMKTVQISRTRQNTKVSQNTMKNCQLGADYWSILWHSYQWFNAHSPLWYILLSLHTLICRNTVKSCNCRKFQSPSQPSPDMHLHLSSRLRPVALVIGRTKISIRGQDSFMNMTQ